MKSIFKTVVPYTCLSITLLLLITIGQSLLTGQDVSFYTTWLIIIASFFVLYVIDVNLMSQINYKSDVVCFLISTLYWYMGIGLALFLSGYMGFHKSNILCYTFWYIVSSIIIRKYNTKRYRLEAEEINSLIHTQEESD